MRLLDRIMSWWGSITKGGNWAASWHQRFDQPGNGGGQTNVNMPYAQSVWVMRGIKKVAQPISAVPLRFEDERSETEIEDEGLRMFWKHPARRLSYHDTIEATVGWLHLGGEAFWLLGDEWLLPYPKQYEPFIIARPDCMTEVVEEGSLVGWRFRDKQGRKHALLPEQVFQHKFWNPYNEWRGLAPYLAAQIATEADYYASTFNRNLWQQNGDRGPFITAKSGQLSDEQRLQITELLREKRAAAARGQFKPAFLTGDISVEDPQIQTIDANAISARLNNRHEIALAFGVPPSMFDVVASYSIGSASDRFILIEETCMPVGAKIAETISLIARRMVKNDNVCAYMDWDEHSTMQAVRRERIDSAIKLWQMGQSMESINAYLQMGMEPYAGWDTGYLSFSLQPVGELNSPAEPMPDEFTPPEDEEDDDEPRALNQIRAAFESKADASQFQASRPKKQISQWRAHEAIQRRLEKMHEAKFNRALMDARGEMLRRLAAITEPTKGLVTKAAATDILFDLHKFTRGLLVGMRQVAITALNEAGQTVMDELEIRDPWKTPPQEVIDFNRSRENKIVGAAREVFKSINGEVEESIKSGESIAKMADRVKAKFNDISRGRAKTIARTETGAAYGQGRQVAMEAAGVEWKEWLTSGLDNVREAHVEANGQRRRVDEPFDVGGEKLMSPGDPAGSAENVINCNCVAISVPGPTEE